MIHVHNSCRVCGRPLVSVVDLGDQHFQGCFIKAGVQRPPMRKTPNEIVRCDTSFDGACGLIQTRHTIDPDILYSNYWYESGISQTMKDHLKSIVCQALEITGTTEGCVLDIASNDNTLLRNYPAEFKKIGIDPSDIAARQTDEDVININTTFPSAEVNKHIPDGGTDIITSIACYYDVEDPVEFAFEIKRLLSNKGVWIFEVAYWKSLLDNLAYDSIVNEHIIHYHLAPLQHIMRLAGLKIFDAVKTTTNGGSMMCFVTHADNISYDTKERKHRMLNIKIDEFDAELDQDATYVEFRSRVQKHKDDLINLINDITYKQNKTIHLYGSSTKLNTILEYCNIGPDKIPYAAERSVQKFDARTLSGIKIVSEEKSRAMKPDYYLVGPYHFKKEILEREKDTIARGTKFIFPLPQITVS